mgnify:CR=1 FL=1
MVALTHQRCFNHADREAVARCPGCGSYFCRECVTEHDERVICAACLRKEARPRLLQRPGFVGVIHFGQALLGLFLAWFFFHMVGDILLGLPSSFHEGSLWKDTWFDME